jgi:hypothetical protein
MKVVMGPKERGVKKRAPHTNTHTYTNFNPGENMFTQNVGIRHTSTLKMETSYSSETSISSTHQP